MEKLDQNIYNKYGILNRHLLYFFEFCDKNSVTERRHLYMDYALYFDTLSDEEILELAKLDNSCFKQNSPFDSQLRQYVLEKLPIVEQRLLNTIIEIDILERNTENNNENKRRDTL